MKRAVEEESPRDVGNEDLASFVAPTESLQARSVVETLNRAATVEAPLLLQGEAGTGKSACARYLAAQSQAGRWTLVIDCPTLGNQVLAGHSRELGGFPADVIELSPRLQGRAGLLVLDEVSALSDRLQASLLHFFDERRSPRSAAHFNDPAAVRIVTTSRLDLESQARAGQFRKDLLYRLNTIEIMLPPLRERSSDILPLARNFLSQYAHLLRCEVPVLSPEAEAALLGHHWPGNVRELQNAMERVVITGAPSPLVAAAFPFAAAPRPAVDFPSLHELERRHISEAIARTSSFEAAARLLGIDTTTLWRKRKRSEDLARAKP